MDILNKTKLTYIYTRMY